MSNLSIAYSRPRACDLLSVIQDSFFPVDRCEYFTSGLHDNYKVISKQGSFLFRIYRSSWRDEGSIFFELDLLDHLIQRGLPVAAAIPNKAGDRVLRLSCPEGERLGVLFPFLPGEAPGTAMTEQQAALLGEKVSLMHLGASGFQTPHDRPPLEIPFLLDNSFQILQPFLDAQQTQYLQGLGSRLRQKISAFEARKANFVACSGDVSSRNFHLDRAGNLYLFDFDQCGFGHRVFEIAKFNSSLHNLQNKARLETAFLRGYQKKCPLDEEEHNLLEFYELLAHLWVMAIHAANAEHIGSKYLQDSFWRRKLEILTGLESRLEW